MRSNSIWTTLALCGVAFAAGWLAGSSSSPDATAPLAAAAPGEARPGARPAADARFAPPRPAPLSPGGDSARLRDEPGAGQAAPRDGARRRAAPEADTPVLTQADVVAAVRAALEQDRDSRNRHERDLWQGGYGEFNYDVNQMSENVAGITDEQKRQYAALLEWRRQARADLSRRLRAELVTRLEFDNGVREMSDYFGQRLRQILDPQQYQQYQARLDGAAGR